MPTSSSHVVFPSYLFHFYHLSSRDRNLPSNSQVVSLVAPKNYQIAHIGSADVKTQSRHRHTLYTLCAALADRPGLLKIGRDVECK